MKLTTYHLPLTTLVILLLFSACIDLDDLFPDDGNNGGNNSPIVTKATLTQGMLSFPSVNDFHSVLEQLDEKLDNFSGYDQYMDMFDGDLDLLDDFLDSIGVDEDIVFTDFENQFGSSFHSMRKYVDEREDAFLEYGFHPAEDENPENRNYYIDDAFRSVVSKDGALKVEGLIFKFFENGVAYVIMNGSMTLFDKLSNPQNYGLGGHSNYFSQYQCTIDPTNIRILTPDLLTPSTVGTRLGSNCKLWYKEKDDKYYNNENNVYVSKIGVYNTFVYDVAVTKIRHYRIKRNGKWKKSRANLKAKIIGSGCGSYNAARSEKYRRRRRKVKRNTGTWFPLVGQFVGGVEWFTYNLLTLGDQTYNSYFHRATNRNAMGVGTGFKCENKCNGITHTVEAIW